MLGGPGGPHYPVTQNSQMIGRSEQAQISLLEPTVSREHATIQLVDDQIVLNDIGSTHGTFVNSRRITTAKLKVGDIIVFGLSMVLRLEESDVEIPNTEQQPWPPYLQDIIRAGEFSTVTFRKGNIPTMSQKRSAPLVEEGRLNSGSHQIQMIQLLKWAAVGTRCAILLPEIQTQLTELHQNLSRTSTLGDGQSVVVLAKALESLMESVTDLVKDSLGSFKQTIEEVSLYETVRESVMQVTPELAHRQITIMTDIPNEYRVRVDPGRFQRAIMELLRNASQSLPPGNIIEIVANSRQPNKTVLTISDQGFGFSQEILDRAFDPFVTWPSDSEALGLGLFEARQIIMSFGGTMEIESQPGSGTIVHLVLPFTE